MLTLNWNIFWIVFNILVFLVLLRIFLFKPLKKIADKRTALIQNEIDSAETKNREAGELKSRYENSLQSAKEESAEIVNSAKNRAQLQYDSIVEKANEEAAHIVRQANIATEAEREQMMREAQTEVASLALAAASRVLGSSVDSDANKKMLDDFLAGERSDK